MKLPDIDIDLADRTVALKIFEGMITPAVQKDGSNFKKHNSGVYFGIVPKDHTTGLCSLDYKEAEKQGFMKIDFLNRHVYSSIDSEEELDMLLSQEPVWELLDHDEIIQQLDQISNQVELVKKKKPRSIHHLAMLIAIIRPGKRHLADYDWNTIEKFVWTPNEDGYTFKKSHAYAYATLIVVQMNQLANILSKGL